jgi:hypothetical protein
MVPSQRPPSPKASWLAKVMFVVSAAVAALALRLAWEEPLAGVVALLAVGVVVAGRYLSRRRTRKMLRSGDVESIISRWSGALRDVPHAETMAPLMTATAFAAHGWVDRAREALRAAERGPAWEAALEHRLFVDTLLLTFEGDNESALERAAELDRLPLPDAGPALVNRVRVLRGAVAALARAFSHRGEDGDRTLLLRASDTSPLVHWAMRYGAAILSVDRGELSHARALLAGAPDWPAESKFHQFHREIADEVRRRADQHSADVLADVRADVRMPAEDASVAASKAPSSGSPSEVSPGVSPGVSPSEVEPTDERPSRPVVDEEQRVD